MKFYLHIIKRNRNLHINKMKMKYNKISIHFHLDEAAEPEVTD